MHYLRCKQIKGKKKTRTICWQTFSVLHVLNLFSRKKLGKKPVGVEGEVAYLFFALQRLVQLGLVAFVVVAVAILDLLPVHRSFRLKPLA